MVLYLVTGKKMLTLVSMTVDKAFIFGMIGLVFPGEERLPVLLLIKPHLLCVTLNHFITMAMRGNGRKELGKPIIQDS